MYNTSQEPELLTKSELKQTFLSGCRPEKEFKIGMEFEKLAVCLRKFKAVKYSGENGISGFLKQYKDLKSLEEINETNGHILGLAGNSGLFTLEPGSQFEFSLNPQNNIHEIKNHFDIYNKETAKLSQKMGICWLGYGIQPLSTHKNIELVPKFRYRSMTSYLPDYGALPLVMMRETASLQVALDYESEEDAISKMRLALMLSPIISGMFANSPIRKGKDSGYMSYRANSWLHTDNNRCGFISEKLFDLSCEFGFDDYVEVLLDVPVIYISRNGNPVNIKNLTSGGLTFRQFLNHGYGGYYPTIDDWHLHMSLFFPDVRLKNYIEIRNCDSQRSELICALPALWKGLLYDKDAMQASFNVVKQLKWDDFNELRSLTPKYGLKAEMNGFSVLDAANELVYIAFESLNKANVFNDAEKNESIYLEPLIELLKNNQTPADVILKNWHGVWNKDISKLVKHVQLK